MKRNVLIAVALAATMTVAAQNIAVVSPSNETDIYQTLDDAIANAEEGSTIYLPGGGCQITTNIDKKLTIMGVSHRGDTDNAEGATMISGSLNFIVGSSGSSVLGVYISGNINVGTSENAVTNLTIKKCNVNSIQVGNSASSGMVVNQCYLRGLSNFGGCNVHLENSIVYSACKINVGIINHCVVTEAGNDVTESVYGNYQWHTIHHYYPLNEVSNTSIMNNFFLNIGGGNSVSNCQIFKNCIGVASWGSDEAPIVLDADKTFNDIFYANKGVKISSDYRIKEKSDNFIGTDGTYIGIEGGTTGFDPDALAPIPRIISKKVDEQSDASGKLTINVTVKAK